MLFSQRGKNSRMIRAAACGDTTAVKVLLANGANVHAEEDYALRYAAGSGHTETVKVLLEAGADVHVRRDEPLRWAALHGHTETVKVLLAAGAEVHVRDDVALRWAAAGGHIDTQMVLQDWIEKETQAQAGSSDKQATGDAEYASWATVPALPDRCPQCGRNVARLPMVPPLRH